MDRASETIINYAMVTGGILIIIGIALAFTGHYFLTVRNTNRSGILEVNGFKGYLFHNFSRLILGILVSAFVIPGLFILTVTTTVPDSFLAYWSDLQGNEHIARPDNMPPVTHYVKGDLTKIFNAPRSSANVIRTLNQGACVAVTERPNNDFYEVSFVISQSEFETGYVDAWSVRKMRPNQTCSSR